VAYEGFVDDVTDCPHWKGRLLERMHFPGQNLTNEIGAVPHWKVVFKLPFVTVVGRQES